MWIMEGKMESLMGYIGCRVLFVRAGRTFPLYPHHAPRTGGCLLLAVACKLQRVTKSHEPPEHST